MAQTTIYFGTAASPKITYSLSSSVAASGTDISGLAVSATLPELDRKTGWSNTWDGDGAIGVYGKRDKTDMVLTCVYSPSSAGFMKDMVAIAEGASLASPLYFYVWPAASAAGREQIYLSGGLVSKVTRPTVDANSGDLFTYEVTIEFGTSTTTVL